MIYALPKLNYSPHGVWEMVIVKRNSDFSKSCQTSKLSKKKIAAHFVSWVSESKFQKQETFFKAAQNLVLVFKSSDFLLSEEGSHKIQARKDAFERHTVP